MEALKGKVEAKSAFKLLNLHFSLPGKKVTVAAGSLPLQVEPDRRHSAQICCA